MDDILPGNRAKETVTANLSDDGSQRGRLAPPVPVGRHLARPSCALSIQVGVHLMSASVRIGRHDSSTQPTQVSQVGRKSI